MTDIEKKRQEIKEGVRGMLYKYCAYLHTKNCPIEGSLSCTRCEQDVNKAIQFLDSQGVGYRVDLKIPENPHNEDSRYDDEVIMCSGFDEAIQKFLELNNGGFEPLKEGG